MDDTFDDSKTVNNVIKISTEDAESITIVSRVPECCTSLIYNYAHLS
jgi:hypothetical protein